MYFSSFFAYETVQRFWNQTYFVISILYFTSTIACRVIVHVRIHKLATGKSETRIWISIRQIYDSTILKANYFFYEKLACLLKDKHHLLNVEKKIKITGVPEKFLKSGKKHNQFWCCYQTCIYWTFVFHKSYFIS